MGWIQSVSGKRVSVTDPAVEMIDIEDIAHALSMLCRFNGHGTKFYSVAEHSVHVSHEIRPDLALAGLLHDAAEAYLGDVPSPLKKHLSEFKVYEARMEAVIAEAFGTSIEDMTCSELKRADVQLLVDEKATLMVAEPEPWPLNAPFPKNPKRIQAWTAQKANEEFLARFNELSG